MTEEIVLNSRFSISLPLRVLPLRLKRESILVRPYVCTVCRDTACRVRVLCYRTPSATLLLVPLAPRGTVVPVRVIRANTPVRPYRCAVSLGETHAEKTASLSTKRGERSGGSSRLPTAGFGRTHRSAPTGTSD